MSPGQLARRLLGSNFQIAGELYRRVFVDMNKVTDAMIRHIPKGASVLDVGGGDGYVVDMLLTKRPDIRVTMTDIAPEIGGFIGPANRDRVTLRPGTGAAEVEGAFDVITLADVVHHVPEAARPGFFTMLSAVAVRTGARTVLVKDVEPRGLRARLALWGDHYITCDRNVTFVSAERVGIPGFERRETEMPDFPNYLLTFAERPVA